MDTTYANPLSSHLTEGPIQGYFFNQVFSNTSHSCQPHGEKQNKPHKQEELSLFAQTVLRLDAEFYAQFPDAKQAYLEQCNHQPIHYGEDSTLPTVPNYTEPVFVSPSPATESSIYTTFETPAPHRPTFGHAPDFEKTCCAEPPPSLHLGWTEQPSNVDIGYVAPEHVRHSRHTASPPPTSPSSHMMTIEMDSFNPSVGHHFSTDGRAANNCVIHTPDLHHVQGPDLTTADHPVANTPPNLRHRRTHRPRKTVRARSYPAAQSRIRLGSPPLIIRRIKLACYYCRKRKIACGVPPEGSTDMTCDQCVKRKLTCEYPLECYRGLKKKEKYDLELKATSVADVHNSDADAKGEKETTC